MNYLQFGPTSYAILLGAGAIFVSLFLVGARWLKNLEASRASVFNATKDGVIVLNRDERIVDRNAIAAFLFQDRQPLVGKKITSLIPEWAEWRAANPDGEFARDITVDLDGHKLTLSLWTAPLLDSLRRRSGCLVMLRDMTEQKRTTEQLAEVSRMKSQLLASLGHDLRSPLGAIIGYAEMLNDGSFGPMTNAQVNASSEILDGANQLLAFMNNMVGQVQMETGRIVIQEHAFDVAEVIGPLLSTLNFHARKKGLTLTQAFDPTLPPQLLGDQFWLRQIVLNLVHNAVKFTKNGFVHISFLRQNDETWMIQVMDTGIGIPAEEQKRVFEAFERLGFADRKTDDGFGLGLSIVAKLTSLMNGKMDLKSEEGKGTTFTVILPLKVPQRVPEGNLKIDA